MKTFFHSIKIILFSILVSISSDLISQNDLTPVCGTVTSAEALKYFNDIKPQLKNYQSQFLKSKSKGSNSKSVSKQYIPIKAHVIRSTDGEGGLDEYELEDVISNLNDVYADAYLEFFLYDGINYIDNDYYCQFKTSKEKSLVESNYVTNTINVYFANRVENAANENICGYTYNIPNYDVIVIQNSCATGNSSLLHEIGHYLSLIHTHGPDNTCMTKELVNGSNCSSEGDQICDTPADPKLTLCNVNNFCRYIGTETDANGDTFNPDTKNIMSYSLKGCRSQFTEQQLARMYAYYMSTKTYLAYGGNAKDVSETDTTNTSLSVKIYPNPISGNLIYVASETNENPENFEICNLMGQVFATGKLLNNQPINIGYLASGTYLMTIRSKNKKIVKKIIK